MLEQGFLSAPPSDPHPFKCQETVGGYAMISRHHVKHFRRALRRKMLRRKQRQAERIYPHDPKRRNANHLAVCSCLGCGNPRKWFGERTLAERRADWALREMMAELSS